MKDRTQNQFSEPIQRVWQHLIKLNWEPIHFIPSAIEFLAQSVVLLIFLILWPYGFFPTIATMIWGLIEESSGEIKKGRTFGHAMPYTVAIGVYFLIFLPFFMICFPIYIIGFIGKYLSGM